MKSAHRRMLLKRWLIGLLLLSGVIAAVLHWSEIKHFSELVYEAQPLWLCVGVVFQLCTYLAVAAAWRVALGCMNRQLSWRSLAALAVAKLFSDQAMPSGGMSGTAFFVAALNRRGIPKSVCLGTLLVSIVSSYAAALLAAAGSVAVIWFFHKLQPWILIVAGLFALVVVAIPAGALWLQHWGKHGIPIRLRRIPIMGRFFQVLGEAPDNLIRNPVVFWTTTAWQMTVIFLDAATLWIMLLAVGQHATFWVALPGFFLASMVAMIGPIPLGLGTFEATSVAVLHLLGIPVAAALMATLLFRGLSMWLPMLPGMWFARREFADPRAV